MKTSSLLSHCLKTSQTLVNNLSNFDLKSIDLKLIDSNDRLNSESFETFNTILNKWKKKKLIFELKNRIEFLSSKSIQLMERIEEKLENCEQKVLEMVCIRIYFI